MQTNNLTRFSTLFAFALVVLGLAACQGQNHSSGASDFNTLFGFESTPLLSLDIEALKDSADALWQRGNQAEATLLYEHLEAASQAQNAMPMRIYANLQLVNAQADRFTNISHITRLENLWKDLEAEPYTEIAHLDSLKGIFLQCIAGLYYTEKDFEKALFYFQKQGELQVKTKGEMSLVVHNNIATSFLEMGKPKEAYQILKPVIEKAATDYTAVGGILYCNYMNAYIGVAKDSLSPKIIQQFVEGFYEKSVENLKKQRKDLHFLYSFQEDYFHIRSKLAQDTPTKLRYLDSALHYTERILTVQDGALWQEQKQNLLAEKLHLILAQKGDTTQIALFEAYIRQGNAILKQNQSLFRKTLAQTQRLRQQERAYFLAQYQREQLQLFILIGGLVFLLLFSAALFLYREWRLNLLKKKRVEAQLAVHLQEYQVNLEDKAAIEAEKERIAALYHNKIKEEESFREEISHLEVKLAMQEALIERKEQTIKAIQDGLQSQKMGLPQLLREIKRENEVELELLQITENIKNLYPDIFRHLRQDYEFLSTKELNVCALSLIDLSNKEMANLLSMSLRGLESLKYRLKKKLDMGTEQDFKTFLIERFGADA
ncbi:helix-turn-helix transcriptional regulator [Hugenholtzia roseola]|uniref:helix-turn-helix transcriptional regulator n=1 Tax=Hugenholtzia roseola TaxID=1002 RepID=UPI0003F98DCA|nr:hypothetical protein [Hugenholtzia roseola]